MRSFQFKISSRVYLHQFTTMVVIHSDRVHWLLLIIAVLAKISATSGTCGGDFSSDEGTVFSPNYPESYGSSARCIYTVTVPTDNQVLLIFQDFQLEDHSACSYDNVKIYDGDSTSGANLGTFCGSKIPPPFISTRNRMTIDFSTDSGTVARGFSAKFEKVTCGGNFVSESGTISSPNFPNEYGPNEKCIYLISVPQGRVALLTFITFELEAEDSCEYDHIKVYDGGNLNSPTLGTLCGFTSPAPIMSSTKKMIIDFRSNSRNQNKGFQVRYETVTCGGISRSETGTISSPSFPNQYGPNEKCFYGISVPYGALVLLTFITFELETEDNCEHDYIKVYDGRYLNSPSIQTFCGFTSPAPILSSGNKLVIEFRSNSRNQNKGFQVGFETVRCIKHYVSDEGIISSPNYPDVYNANERCYFKVSVPEGYRLVLTFQDFELETRDNCSHDNVTIYDGTDLRSPSLGYFCGFATPRPILFSANKGTIGFRSDDTNQYRGFSAKFQKVKCGGTFFSENGTISSPNFPSKYNPNERCLYVITVPPRSIVLLNFQVFELETQEQCAYDFIKIYDGNVNLGQFCGSTIPGSILSSGNSVTIDFRSDHSNEYRGFSAEFKAEILCVGSTCENGGTCIRDRVNGTSRCICRQGYRGLKCEEKILCSNDTCENGGICTQDGLEGTIRCSCQDGYHGLMCERSALCNINTCKNGGTCTIDSLSGTFNCSCRHGYRGLKCTEIVSESACDGATCKNGGTCKQDDINGISWCTCMPGYRGQRCEERIICRDNPCKNGGLCLQDETGDVYRCMCEYGYSGPTCEETNLPYSQKQHDNGGSSFPAMFYIGIVLAVVGIIACILAIILTVTTKIKSAPVIPSHEKGKDDELASLNTHGNTYELI